MKTNTSRGAIGLVLEQEEYRKLQLITFYSRQLTQAERNYDTHDREILAIMEGFKYWRHYLQGAKEEVTV